MTRDLNLACIKAVVSLTAKLPLQTADSAREADLNEAKNRLFNKHFSFLLKLLRLCSSLEVSSEAPLEHRFG